MTNKVKSISDLLLMFHRNERPIYFISATNFNLLGIDRWVNRFRYISYIDCFDGRHPNVFVPSETPHAEFESIEDINNYLLQHKEVIDLIERRGGKPVATFLMFDEKTEALARELGMEVWFPPAKLRQRCDNKMETVRIGNKAGVYSVPNALEKVEQLRAPDADRRSRRPGPRSGHPVGLRRLGPHDLLHRQRKTTSTSTRTRSSTTPKSRS